MSHITLIFLHGNSSSSKEWERVVDILSGRCKCLSWNLFGHGNEDSLLNPSLSAQTQFIYDRILKEIEEDYILVGHSLGGHVAIQVTALAEMVGTAVPSGLITIGTPPISKKDIGIKPWIPNDDVKEVFPLLLKEEQFTYEEARDFVRCQGFPEEDLETFISIAKSVDGRGRLVARECLQPDDSVVDEYEYISKLNNRIPYMCLQGENDGGVNTDYLKSLSHSLIIIPEAEHAAPWTHPREVSDCITRFISFVLAPGISI